MCYKRALQSAAILLLGVMALVAQDTFVSHVSAGRPAGPGSSPSKTVTVVIREFKFDPLTVTVHEGDTVEWKNKDIVPHTATADGGAKNSAFDSRTIRTGAAWRFVARKKGTFSYSCTLHPIMRGKLVVQ